MSNSAINTEEPEVIANAFFEADTQELINMCVANPSDTVYAQCLISVITGGRQLDVDHFEDEYTEELKTSLEATLVDGVITIEIEGYEKDDVIYVLKINEIEV